MKAEQIYDAITDVNDNLVDAAGNYCKESGLCRPKSRNRNTRKRNIRFAVTALVTAAAILVGVIVWPDSSSTRILKASAIVEATYPEMVQYPKDLSEDDPSFWTAYEEWSDALWERKDHITEKNYNNKLKDYASNTLRTFLSDTNGENRTVSPLNIYMALGMLAEITDGNSREQLLGALGCTTIEELRSTANSVWNANYRNDGIMTNILASSLWLNNNIRFNSDTLNTLADTYYASSYSGEMGSPELDAALQNWLNEQTGGLLEAQISDISLDPLTVIALATTVQFHAKWETSFSSQNTTPQTFHTPNGDISCDFMHSSPDTGYYWGEKFAAVALNFDSGSQMKIILPDEGYSPEDLLAEEEVLNFMTSNVYDWANEKYVRVNMAIPKFDISSQLELSDGLKALGVTDVFDASVADYSPLTKSHSEALALSEALHGVRVTIDEEGCTAAAYTVMVNEGAFPPEDEVDFVADRPFLFVITDHDNLPLFAGVVNQP